MRHPVTMEAEQFPRFRCGVPLVLSKWRPLCFNSTLDDTINNRIFWWDLTNCFGWDKVPDCAEECQLPGIAGRVDVGSILHLCPISLFQSFIYLVLVSTIVWPDCSFSFVSTVQLDVLQLNIKYLDCKWEVSSARLVWKRTEDGTCPRWAGPCTFSRYPSSFLQRRLRPLFRIQSFRLLPLRGREQWLMVVAEMEPIGQLRLIAAPLSGSLDPGAKKMSKIGVIYAQQHREDLVLGGARSTPESRLLQMDTACWPDKWYHSPITHAAVRRSLYVHLPSSRRMIRQAAVFFPRCAANERNSTINLSCSPGFRYVRLVR